MGKRQRKALDGVVEKRKCTATRKNGDPCKRPPIKGGSVCMSHGGAAPQVRRKANERLLQGVPKMLSELRRLATDETLPPNVRLAAVRDWLDRAGIGESDKHELTLHVPLWQQDPEVILVDYNVGDPEAEPESYSPTARAPLPLDPSDPTPPGYGSRHA